jgi:hypothetical protein
MKTRRRRVWLTLGIPAAVYLTTLGTVTTARTVERVQSQEPLREGTCEQAGELFPDTNPGPGSLKHIPVPDPANLTAFVRNRAAAIALGKALFWDMQVGSDGV